MAQRLSVLTALSEDLGSTPALTWQFTTVTPRSDSHTERLMQDVLLYSVNMCFPHWLMNKCFKEQSQAGNPNKDTEREKAESGRRHVTTERVTQQGITCKPQPYGDTQINRNGPNYHN